MRMQGEKNSSPAAVEVFAGPIGEAPTHVIYELRTYRCAPGRLGEVVDRTIKHAVPLWEKHGIHHVGFWTVVIGNSNNDFIYLLRWGSAADREAKWPEFMADPDWVAARAKTEAAGPLINSVNNQFLAPTAFSGLQ